MLAVTSVLFKFYNTSNQQKLTRRALETGTFTLRSTENSFKIKAESMQINLIS